MSVIRQCRFCACTEDDPCRVESGEDCILMADRGYCTNPRCIMAADLERKTVRRATETTRREAVKPIRERWHEAIARRRKESEMQRKRRRKTKGRAA